METDKPTTGVTEEAQISVLLYTKNCVRAQTLVNYLEKQGCLVHYTRDYHEFQRWFEHSIEDGHRYEFVFFENQQATKLYSMRNFGKISEFEPLPEDARYFGYDLEKFFVTNE